MALEIYRSEGLGEPPRLKAKVSRSGFVLSFLSRQSGEWEELHRASGYKSPAEALEGAKHAMATWTLNPEA